MRMKCWQKGKAVWIQSFTTEKRFLLVCSKASFVVEVPPAFLSGIHWWLLEESKDGRHHYAACSSMAKIRAGGQLRRDKKSNLRDLSCNFLSFTDIKPYINFLNLLPSFSNVCVFLASWSEHIDRPSVRGNRQQTLPLETSLYLQSRQKAAKGGPLNDCNGTLD